MPRILLPAPPVQPRPMAWVVDTGVMVEQVPVQRIEYLKAPIEGFEVDSVPGAPLELFRTWLAEAVEFGLPEPNAATLATVDGRGHPSVRLMLVKIVDPRGFCFFTNHGSRKGRDLEQTGNAALLFPWHGMHRQVAVRGRAERMPRRSPRRTSRPGRAPRRSGPGPASRARRSPGRSSTCASRH